MKKRIDILFIERRLLKIQLYEALVVNNAILEAKLEDRMASIRNKIVSLYKMSNIST
jgi:hypothetical protein